MNGWERNGKRLCKGALWAPAYLFGAISLGFTPSWQLLLLIIGCNFWGSVLDVLIPTDSASHPSTVREAE